MKGPPNVCHSAAIGLFFLLSFPIDRQIPDIEKTNRYGL